jgi:hypothetical protein
MKKSIFIALISISIFSCNKEKPFSRKLMKGETWVLESLKINGVESEFHGVWNVTQDVNIYDSVPQISWNTGINDAVFQWQFQEKGKKFYINYQQQCAECNGSDLDTLDYLTFNLTGSYDVVKHKRKEMIFTSSSLAAYPGKEVEIQLTRK